MKRLLPIAFILSVFFSTGQTLRFSGNVKDTATKQTLPNALLMAVKFNDSTLVNFTRTDKDGIFKPIQLPVDTYIVIISHPNFSDKTYLLVPNKGDTAFKFRNVVLPPKSVQLNEVEVVAYKDKMYYKGDTLQFTADSFKMKANATVEDLLKKLPGVKVDASGKITIQGKEVDQVLVDGDEFFGTDPTIATKNLNANTVETVQVYEKKSENTEGGGDETVKIVNLKLKEDSKKGYFGKISAASDFQKFYENDLLVNRFKKQQKVSLFGLVANTPKQSFGWGDANKYGLSNENQNNYDPETNTWGAFQQNAQGIPQTLKTGFYFNDKIGKNTKINTDYTFKQSDLVTGSETNTQFFLSDTSYTNKQKIGNSSKNMSHNFNLRIVQKLDSLTELTVRPKISYSNSNKSNYQYDEFVSESNDLTRETSINNKSKGETIDASLQLKLNRNFKKKDRNLSINYQPSFYNSTSNSDLNTNFRYFLSQDNDSSLLQKRAQSAYKQEHNATITYIEPLSKKLKTEIGYGFSHNLNGSNRKTLDFDGIAYDKINTGQSNDFRNTRISNRIGGKLIYEVKKYRISLGTNYRSIFQENVNVTTNQKLNQTFNNVLPFGSFRYRINQGSSFDFFYNSSAKQPDLQQLQPVIDNSDPNRITTGNPALKPEFTNNFSVNYYFYKGISDVNMYAGCYYNTVSNEINEKTVFDADGRSITSPVNINGNSSGNVWFGGGFPVFKRFMKINYNFSTYFNKNVSYINNEKNYTDVLGFFPGLSFSKQIDLFEVELGGNYSYNLNKQTISVNSNKPYYSYGLNGNLRLNLPKKVKLSVEANYTNNGNRANGYNINYTVLNASISKSFFKSESLIASFDANDILNQNISNNREVSTNKIVDTKTQIIKQYFLLRLTYKFTSQKEKKEEDND